MPKQIDLVLKSPAPEIKDGILSIPLQTILKKNGIVTNKFNFLGRGSYGVVFDIGDNKVLKITEDDKEIDSTSVMQKYSHKNIVEFYNVFRVDKSEYLIDFPEIKLAIIAGIIIEEYCYKLPNEMKELIKFLDRNVFRAAINYNSGLGMMFKEFFVNVELIFVKQGGFFNKKTKSYNKMLKQKDNKLEYDKKFVSMWEATQKWRTKNKTIQDLKNSIDKDLKKSGDKRAINIFNFEPFDGYIEGIQHINKHVQYIDFHEGNIMLGRDGEFKFLDLSEAQSYEAPKVEPLKIEQNTKLMDLIK